MLLLLMLMLRSEGGNQGSRKAVGIGLACGRSGKQGLAHRVRPLVDAVEGVVDDAAASRMGNTMPRGMGTATTTLSVLYGWG